MSTHTLEELDEQAIALLARIEHLERELGSLLQRLGFTDAHIEAAANQFDTLGQEVHRLRKRLNQIHPEQTHCPHCKHIVHPRAVNCLRCGKSWGIKPDDKKGLPD